MQQYFRFCPWKNSWFQLALIGIFFSLGLLAVDMKGMKPIPFPPIPIPSIFHPGPTPAQIAQSKDLYNQAETAINNGNYDNAIQDLNQAVQLNPQYGDAFDDLGRAYDNKGDQNQAILQYNQALQINPQDYTSLNNRGYAYYEEHDYNNSLADLTKSVQIKPDYALAYDNRGYTNFALGNESDALQDFTRAFQIDGTYSDAYKMAAWILATSSHDDLRDGRKALDYANKANSIAEGKDSSIISTLAAAYAESGDYDSAVRMMTQFLATPNIPAKDLADAQAQMACYRAGRPYHRGSQ